MIPPELLLRLPPPPPLPRLPLTFELLRRRALPTTTPPVSSSSSPSSPTARPPLLLSLTLPRNNAEDFLCSPYPPAENLLTPSTPRSAEGGWPLLGNLAPPADAEEAEEDARGGLRMSSMSSSMSAASMSFPPPPSPLSRLSPPSCRCLFLPAAPSPPPPPCRAPAVAPRRAVPLPSRDDLALLIFAAGDGRW